jgi:hypothetical protein
MTRLPRSSGSTLVLRLNQEIVHDLVPLVLPPCGLHLTSLATGSLEPSLLVFSTPGGLTSDDLSRLFFTCTNTSQAATCTCNTWPRVSPHNVVNHSSHQEATIHRSSNHTLSLELRRDPTGVSTQGGRSEAGTSTPCTTTPRRPSSLCRPQLHHRPNLSATAAFFTSPPLWSLLCVELAVLRRAAMCTCLSAGHRAAGLLPRDRVVLLGHSCP